MPAPYQLFRADGVLVFNAFGDGVERFWVSILAAAQAGGPMYAEVDRATFDAVWSGAADAVDVAAPRFMRAWHPEQESATARQFGLEDAIDAHELKAAIDDPVRSVVAR